MYISLETTLSHKNSQLKMKIHIEYATNYEALTGLIGFDQSFMIMIKSKFHLHHIYNTEFSMHLHVCWQEFVWMHQTKDIKHMKITSLNKPIIPISIHQTFTSN